MSVCVPVGRSVAPNDTHDTDMGHSSTLTLTPPTHLHGKVPVGHTHDRDMGIPSTPTYLLILTIQTRSITPPHLHGQVPVGHDDQAAEPDDAALPQALKSGREGEGKKDPKCIVDGGGGGAVRRWEKTVGIIDGGGVRRWVFGWGRRSTHHNVYTHIPTHIPTYIHTYIHTYLHTYLPTYTPTYTHIPTHIPGGARGRRRGSCPSRSGRRPPRRAPIPPVLGGRGGSQNQGIYEDDQAGGRATDAVLAHTPRWRRRGRGGRGTARRRSARCPGWGRRRRQWWVMCCWRKKEGREFVG